MAVAANGQTSSKWKARGDANFEIHTVEIFRRHLGNAAKRRAERNMNCGVALPFGEVDPNAALNHFAFGRQCSSQPLRDVR